MNDPYQPATDFTHGAKIWGAFVLASLLLITLLPRIAILALAFGSLAAATHIYRAWRHSSSQGWRAASAGTILVIAGTFVAAAIWFAEHHNWAIAV